MSTPMDEKQVIQWATALENDFTTFRKEGEDRLRLFGLYKIPSLPKNIQRGNQINMLSPDIIDAAESIRSDLLPMLTEIMVDPMARDARGLVPEGDKKKADNLEHAHAAILDMLDRDRHLSRPLIWRQLVDHLGIFTLSCRDTQLPLKQGMSAADYKKAEGRYLTERFAWEAHEVDPFTCAWDTKDGIPTVMMRRYRQLIITTQQQYSRARTPNGNNGDISLEGGKWVEKTISDDQKITATTRQGGFSLGPVNIGGRQVRDLEMIWLSDGEYTYHVAMDADNKAGRLVWWGPTYFGRCAAFLVPAIETGMREPHNKYYPQLYPLMVVTEQLNTVNTIRATAARNRADQQAYAPYDPETVRQLKAAGIEPPTHVKWGPSGEIPYTATQKILEREVIVDPDFAAVAEDLKELRQQYRPASTAALADPSLIKEGTLGALLNAQETALKKLGPLVTSRDSALRQALEAIEHSLPHYKGEYGSFTLFASQASAYAAKSAKGKSPDAKAFAFDAEAIDFPHRIIVSTKAMTMGQAAAQYEYRASQRAAGDATNEMVWEAANISDIEQFVFDKAKEQIVNDPILIGTRQQYVRETFLQKVQLEMGFVPPEIGTAAAAAGVTAPGQPGAPAAGAPPPPPGAAPPPGKPQNAIRGRTTNAPNVAGPPSATTPVNGSPV